MNTVDPAVPYGTPKEEQREPMFTRYYPDDEGEMHMDIEGEFVKFDDVMSKIASGELRVVKRGDIEQIAHGWTSGVDGARNQHTSKHRCIPCQLTFSCQGYAPALLCPGCGAQIAKG